MKAASLPAAAIALALGAGQAFADDDEQNSVIVRIGAGWADPSDDSNWLRLDGTALADTRVHVDDSQSGTFTGSWLFADHWGVGLLVSFPFDHDLEVSGLPPSPGNPPPGRIDLGNFEYLLPTVTLQWFPMRRSSWIQPYVGLGVNYTAFMDENISTAADDYFAAAQGAQMNADLDMDDSWGLAGELGVDVSLGRNNQWLFNAAVWYLDMDTEVKIHFPTNFDTKIIKTDLEINPWVYSVGIGYRF